MRKTTFTNQEIARLLENVAAAYEVKNENRFRIVAYQRAAVSVEHSTSELKDLWDDKKLDEIPGIGEGISSYLDELFRTGRVKHFEWAMKGLPKSMFVFMQIPGIGPKTAYILAKSLKITSEKGSIEKLRKAAKAGKIRFLENFGEKSETDILEGIASFKKGELKEKRMLLPYADTLASEIISFLKEIPEVIEADPLGSLRRMVATIGDIDISVSTNDSKKVMDHFVKFKKVRTVLERGKEALLRVVLFSGQQVDLRFSKSGAYGAMLQYFTGSKMHNIELRTYALKMGKSLSEYGIKKVKSSKLKVKSYGNEEDFYKEISLEWIPPELREGKGEIEASKSGKLPKLVELSDIKGDLHIHSDFPIEPSHDLGISPAIEIINKAETLEYEYIGFSEHNPSNSKHTEKEMIEILKKKKDYFDQLNYSYKARRTNKVLDKIFNGLEIDIKPDGNLAIPIQCFDYLDYAIVSVHSTFDMSREKMTKRVLFGLSHPKAKILGHPTGRLLEEREGYELDWDLIFDFCVKNRKILEISAWPNRLDLPDTLVHEAIKQGVKVVINSDSHEVSQMVNMKYGVSVARRGWAEGKDVINCLPYEKISDILLV